VLRLLPGASITACLRLLELGTLSLIGVQYGSHNRTGIAKIRQHAIGSCRLKLGRATKRWFHNGWSLRAQISAQARWRNAVRMSARRS
jgi:hypothetical protein